MDEKQKKLLMHMALLAAFGGGSGAMMGSGSGAMMGGLSLPLIYLLLQRSGALGNGVPSGDAMSPSHSATMPPVAFNQPKHHFMDDFRRKAKLISMASAPTKVFGRHADPDVQNMIMQGRAARFNRWAQDQLMQAPDRFDSNNVWTAKSPTTQVGQNAKTVEDISSLAGFAPLAGVPLMALPGRAGGLGRTLWNRTFIPASVAEDTAKTVKNVAEHGWENAALLNADTKRRALLRAPLARYGSAVEGGAPIGDFSSEILMAPFRPVSNLQTIAGGIGAMTDATGRDYVTPPWHNQRTYRPERQVASQLESQRKTLLDKLYARGVPMDAVRPSAPNLSFTAADNRTDGWTPPEGDVQSVPRVSMLPRTQQPMNPMNPQPEDFLPKPQKNVQKNTPLKDRAAHRDPNGAAYRYYFWGGK